MSLTCPHLLFIYFGGLPQWLSSKESTCNAGDAGSILGSERSPGGGNGYSLQYSCRKNPMDGRAWQATVYGVAELDPIEATKHIYFWLCWVLAAVCRISLVAASRGHSSLWCVGLSLQWPPLLQSMGARCTGFSNCGRRDQELLHGDSAAPRHVGSQFPN